MTEIYSGEKTVGQMRQGACFEYDGDIYMKTDMYGFGACQAVRLKDGKMHMFSTIDSGMIVVGLQVNFDKEGRML